MKEFIKNSGLTAAQFAKKYGIPYNTVRQWAEGIRKAPEWLIKLLEEKPLIEYRNNNAKNEKYFVEFKHVKTNTTIYSRTMTYEEINDIEKNYWYVEYIKNQEGYIVNYYKLKKI